MTYRGRVQNGVVVFDGDAPPEGTVVRVDSASSVELPPRGSPERILMHAGTWAGTAEEMERLLAEMREMKQAEVEREGSGGDDPIHP